MDTYKNIVAWMLVTSDMDTKEFCKRLGISKQTFYNRNTRQTWSSTELAKAAAICGCKIDLVVTREDGTELRAPLTAPEKREAAE